MMKCNNCGVDWCDNQLTNKICMPCEIAQLKNRLKHYEPDPPVNIEEISHYLGGFTLCGKNMGDGTIESHLTGDKPLTQWPEEVVACGKTYTRESIELGPNHCEEAEYA